MRKTRNKKPSEVDNTRLTLTTTLRALRNAVNGKRMTYRAYMEIAKALGGAKKYGRDTPINFRWIVDTFPRLPHVVYLQFCEGQRCRLMRQLLYALCRDVAEELSLESDVHQKADVCIAYLRAALAGEAFNTRTADARIRHIEKSFIRALVRYCRHVKMFLMVGRKQQTTTEPAAFDALYPRFIAVIEALPAPHVQKLIQLALVSFLRPRKA